MWPAPPGRGECVPGFWLEQAYADQPPVVIDALDHVAGQLELGDDGGRERNPAGVQLGKTDRLVAGLAQALQQPLLLDVSERHRRIGDLQRDCGRLERFQATLLAPDVWRLGVWPPPTAPAAIDSRALRSSPLTWRRCPLRRRELEHESNAWLATSANSTRSTSVANRLGPEHLCERAVDPKAPDSTSSSHTPPSDRETTTSNSPDAPGRGTRCHQRR